MYAPIEILARAYEASYDYNPAEGMEGMYYETYIQNFPEQKNMDMALTINRALTNVIPYLPEENFSESVAEKRQKYTVVIENEDFLLS